MPFGRRPPHAPRYGAGHYRELFPRGGLKPSGVLEFPLISTCKEKFDHNCAVVKKSIKEARSLALYLIAMGHK